VELSDGITLRGFRVVRSNDGLFIGLPQREYKVDGVPRYVNQIVFRDADLREQFTAELMKDYERWASEKTDGTEAAATTG
jgi:DNA-binding cell septation regulator SpoVG